MQIEQLALELRPRSVRVAVERLLLHVLAHDRQRRHHAGQGLPQVRDGVFRVAHGGVRRTAAAWTETSSSTGASLRLS